MLYRADLEKNLHVCPKCAHHFRITARERLQVLFDEGIWTEHHVQLASNDPLHFTDTKAYRDRLREDCPAVRFVFIDIDKALALQRVAALADRHFFSTTLVDSQFATLESPVGEPGVITVPAALTLEEQVDRALALLAPKNNQETGP